MVPRKFEEANVVFAKDQKEYMPLPAYRNDDGEVVSCWRLSFIERCRVLLKGEIWLSLKTFNKPLTPSFLTTKKKDIFE